MAKLLEERPEVGVVIEQPQSSSLRGDSRMASLGLREVELDGCAFGLRFQKPYVLWTNLTTVEFLSRETTLFCQYCAAKPTVPGAAHCRASIAIAQVRRHQFIWPA